MGIKRLNTNKKINIKNIKDEENYLVGLNASGKFIKEVTEILSEENEPLFATIARCLSFCRQCKEIEAKGGELRFRLNNQTYRMKFPKK